MLEIDGELVTQMEPEKREHLDLWKKNISAYDYSLVVDAINRYVDSLGVKNIIAAAIPKENWDRPEFKALTDTCEKVKNVFPEASIAKNKPGTFFGAIFFEVIMKRKDALWSGCKIYRPFSMMYKKIKEL